MTGAISRAERQWALRWAVAVVALSCLPYLLAWALAPDETHYTGLLLNPLDGESYYAKMQQGARGDWLFHLPYTPEPHEGAPVYGFYLALGHLAGLLSLPIPLVYHLARAAAGLFLLLVAYGFIAHFVERPPLRRAAFLLLAFSAGFGWLLAPLGILVADLWVAEGFAFFSILINPHFPLGIGLMLLLFLAVLTSGEGRPTARRLAATAAGGLLLAVVHPFAVPVVLAALAVYLAVRTARERRVPWAAALAGAALAGGAAPVVLYDLYLFRTNPALAAWSAQNVTTSLPPWNYALGYGLVLLLAIPGIVVAARRRRSTDHFLLAWVGSAAVLLYVPFALQRRFITGLHVPLVLLAAMGLEQVVWQRVGPRRQGLATGLLVAVASLSNVFVLLVAVAGVAAGRAPLVMTRGEAAACDWLAENTTWTDTVLTPIESGQFIPAWAGNRVVYGHPFETIDAKAKQEQVSHFYSPAATTAERRELLDRYQVRYLLILGEADKVDVAALGLVRAWTSDGAALYRVEAGQ